MSVRRLALHATTSFLWHSTPLLCAALLFGACGGGGGGGGGGTVSSANDLPGIARVEALSQHFVEVGFLEPAVPHLAEEAERYEIVGPGGVELDVVEASLSAERDLLRLTTGPQLEASYQLLIEGAEHSFASVTNGSREIITFDGSTLGEVLVVSAIAVDPIFCDSAPGCVLVSFNQPVNTITESYRIFVASTIDPRQVISELELTEVEGLDNGRRALITTSEQRNVEYTVKVVIADIDFPSDGPLINPFMNTATFFGIAADDNEMPKLLGAEALSATEVLVSFSEPMDQLTLRPEYFLIEDPSGATESPVIVEDLQVGDFGTRVLLRTDVLAATIEYTLTIDPAVTDLSGNPIDPTASSETFTFEGPGLDEELVRLIGAAAIANDLVTIQFSRPMADSALEARNYQIFQDADGQVGDEIPQLIVHSAEFVSGQRTRVHVTTSPQNGVRYILNVLNVTDLSGEPLAATVSEFLSAANSATFTGVPPRCVGLCAAESPSPSGLDGRGACFSDDHCDDDAPCESAEADCAGRCVGACELIDSDGDGLPDNVEQAGWVVTIFLGNGEVIQRHVTSDPFSVDTDGDTVSDIDELRELSDPRSIDTDGDQLTDEEEFAIFASLFNMDTDGDGIFDGWEFHTFKTNALVADTDGDGFTDDRELFEMNRDPRIADIPQQEIIVGDVRLQIDERFTFTNDRGQTVSVESSTAASHERARENALTVTQFGSTQATDASDIGGGFQLGLGGIGLGGGINADKGANLIASLNVNFHREVSTTTSTETQAASVVASTEAFESSLVKGSEFTTSASVTREVFGASLDVDLTIRNVGDIAYTLDNLELTALATDPQDRTRLLPVASLVPASTLVTGNPLTLNLAPGDTRGPLVFSSRDVIPSLVEDLMRQPRDLVFKIGNFDISDEFDRNLAFVLQEVQERTAAILIDPGDGSAQVHRVATNATIDEQDLVGGGLIGGIDDRGHQVGIPLEFALQDILGLEKNRSSGEPDGILAGQNGVADSFAEGDDIQVVPVGTSGLPRNAVVITAGPNGALDTRTPGRCGSGSDLNRTCFAAEECSGAAACDPGLCIEGERDGLPCESNADCPALASDPHATAVFCAPLDERDVTSGYETSPTCSVSTPRRLVDGGNMIADTDVDESTSDDVQLVALGGPVTSGSPVVEPGLNGFLDTVPGGDDIFQGPGNPCAEDAECPGGACTGRETLVRIGSRRSGEFRRFWAILANAEILGDNFGDITLERGRSLGLAFVQDIDRDGLLAREEIKFGSSDTRRDTDGDGLDDFSEIRIGWEVGVVGSSLRQVFPDPRRPDSDGDGLTDGEEQSLAQASIIDPTTFGLSADDPMSTDPTRRDTDRDMLSDFDEALGFLAGAGIFDPAFIGGIIAGPDGVADTEACGGVRCTGGINVGAPCNPLRGDRDCLDAQSICLGGPDDGSVCRDLLDCRRAACSGPRECVLGSKNGSPCAADSDCFDDFCVGRCSDTGALCSNDDQCTGPVAATCVNVCLTRGGPCASDQDCSSPTSCRSTCSVGPNQGSPCAGEAPCLILCAGNVCDGGPKAGLPCESNVQCPEGGSCGAPLEGTCVQQNPSCDDLQIVAAEAAGLSEATVVVAAGPDSIFQTNAVPGDVIQIPEDPTSNTDARGDDQQVVIRGQVVGGSGVVIRPGPDGLIQSAPGGDDILFLGRFFAFTDPLNPDTDFDQIPDGIEQRLGSDPALRDAGDLADQDQDGLTDDEEALVGWNVTVVGEGTRQVFSSSFAPDTDLDGLPDLLERSIGSDPTLDDTDGDGLSDFDEFAAFEDFVDLNVFFPGFFVDGSDSQQHGTSVVDRDTDGDTLDDHFELLTGWRVSPHTRAAFAVLSDPLLVDTDGDGLEDGEEFLGADGIAPCGPSEFCSIVPSPPCCADSFDATDPTNPDTDDDGRSDSSERDLGGNPLRPDVGVTVRLAEFEPLIVFPVFPPCNCPSDFGVVNGWVFDIRVREARTGTVHRIATTKMAGLDGEVARDFAPSGGNQRHEGWLFPPNHLACDRPNQLPCQVLNRGEPGNPDFPDFALGRLQDCEHEDLHGGPNHYLFPLAYSSIHPKTGFAAPGKCLFGRPCFTDADCEEVRPTCESVVLGPGITQWQPCEGFSWRPRQSTGIWYIQDKDLVSFSPPFSDLSVSFDVDEGDPFIIEVEMRGGGGSCALSSRIARTASGQSFERVTETLCNDGSDCQALLAQNPSSGCLVGLNFEIIVDSGPTNP